MRKYGPEEPDKMEALEYDRKVSANEVPHLVRRALKFIRQRGLGGPRSVVREIQLERITPFKGGHPTWTVLFMWGDYQVLYSAEIIEDKSSSMAPFKVNKDKKLHVNEPGQGMTLAMEYNTARNEFMQTFPKEAANDPKPPLNESSYKQNTLPEATRRPRRKAAAVRPVVLKRSVGWKCDCMLGDYEKWCPHFWPYWEASVDTSLFYDLAVDMEITKKSHYQVSFPITEMGMVIDADLRAFSYKEVWGTNRDGEETDEDNGQVTLRLSYRDVKIWLEGGMSAIDLIRQVIDVTKASSWWETYKQMFVTGISAGFKCTNISHNPSHTAALRISRSGVGATDPDQWVLTNAFLSSSDIGCLGCKRIYSAFDIEKLATKDAADLKDIF
jgi:hypothetical protein